MTMTMETSADFTHILDIKIIDKSNGNIVKNKDLLGQVKKSLRSYEYKQTISSKEFIISWKKKKWSFPYNKFIGDLTANYPYIADYIIQEHTELTFKSILEHLRKKRSYWNEFDIIFNLSKPLIIKPLTSVVPKEINDEEPWLAGPIV